MLPFIFPADHAAVLARIVTALDKDLRFDSLLGGGSLVHGGFDQQSDLDLVLVVRPDAHQEVMGERHAIARRIGGLLAAFTGEHVGEPRLLICLYGPPLIHVDLKFARSEELAQLVERPVVLWSRAPEKIAAELEFAQIQWPDRPAQWFEDRAWIWLHYGATKWQRGELFEAIGMLAFIRENILGPMWRRNAGLPQRGVRRIDDDTAARLALAQTAPAYDAAEVKEALMKAIQLYLELRESDPPSEQTREMPKALSDFIEQARS